MKKKAANPIIFKSGLSLGQNSAEADDEFLFDCFVELDTHRLLADLDSPKMILAGRTGAGKTAIIRWVGRNNARATEIDPFEVSLNYVSNSDIIRFLHAVGADLDLLFQILWKHILCIEFIRIRYDVIDAAKWSYVFSRIADSFGWNPRRQAALRYLREYDGKLWLTLDENIKEITEKFNRKLLAEFEADYKKLKSKVNYDRGVSREKRAEIIARCRKIITPDQLADLAKLIELLADDTPKDSGAKYYLLLDKLDEKWVDDQLRFRLIRALIESLRSFRKIRSLKLVVALRTDVLERVVMETSDLGFQREKYDDYVVPLEWRKEELRLFISKRISTLVKRKYAGRDLGFSELFCRKVEGADPFDYICERTLNRPRDVLAFCNLCLRFAVGSQEVSAKHIKEAEREYSRVRHQALVDEWRSAFPTLPILLHFIASNGAKVELGKIATRQVIEDLVVKIWGDESLKVDPLYKSAETVANTQQVNAILDFARQAVSILYRVGAVGVKLKPTDKLIYAHRDTPIIPESLLSEKTQIRLHPMLHRALNVGGAAVEAAD